MSSEDLLPENRSLPATPVTYYVKDYLPPNPDVLMVFHGLLWFTYHGIDECLIGIHNTTHGHLLHHHHQHDLKLCITKITGRGTAQRRYERQSIPIPGNPKDIEGIQIDVNNPHDDKRGVYVYQKDPFYRPPHSQEGNDCHDWRWVLDFEQPPFYHDPIKLKPKTVSSVISINHGLFYTLRRTTSTFELLPGSGESVPIGNVAQFLGGNIYLKDDGDVTLTVRYPFPKESITRTLKRMPGTYYQIDIRNDCLKPDGTYCKFEKPDHPTDKKKRNDFYLYYDCFKVPSGAHEIGLKLKQRGEAPHLPDYVVYENESQEHLDANNDSPCGAVVAGRGGNGT